MKWLVIEHGISGEHIPERKTYAPASRMNPEIMNIQIAVAPPNVCIAPWALVEENGSFEFRVG